MIGSCTRIASRLRDDRRGATLVEFGIVLVPFLILIMGSLDLGYQVYLRAVTAGAVEKVARRATVGNMTAAEVTAAVRDEVSTTLPQDSRDDPNAVQVSTTNYFNFSAVSMPGERITGDTVPLGTYNSGDCYEDQNNNGHYDAAGAAVSGVGGADDIVYYTVTVTVPRLFPLASLIGWSNTASVTTRTLIRNQPYGEQTEIIRCSST